MSEGDKTLWEDELKRPGRGPGGREQVRPAIYLSRDDFDIITHDG
jgi:hypothetical protein